MSESSIRYVSYPKTDPPPNFAAAILDTFQQQEKKIATSNRQTGLSSNQVLSLLRKDLIGIGFDVEDGSHRIERPVFFGENGAPTVNYRVDAYHAEWQCGMEIEAGRSWMGNAVYRDIVQALVMTQVHHLVLAVPNVYRYSSSGKQISSEDYRRSKDLLDALYGHSRIVMPYGLTLIGY